MFKKGALLVSLVTLIVTIIAGNTYYNNKVNAQGKDAYEAFQASVEEEKNKKINELKNVQKEVYANNMKGVEIKGVKTDLFDSLNNKETAKIVFLGDSTTEKNKYTNGKLGHVELISSELSKIYGHNLKVVNSGVSGNTIIDMNNRLDKAVISHRPDLVIINSGINDATKGVALSEFEKTYRKVIERIQSETNASIIIRTSNPTLGQETNDILENTINPIVKSLAKEYEIGFVDAYNYYLQVTGEDPEGIEKYNYNYSHPNELGQKIIGDLVLTSLLQDS